MKTPQSRHSRYTEQAIWSASLRQYLVEKTSLQIDSRILEVGCGTGAVLDSLQGATEMTCFGVDINLQDLHFLHQTYPVLTVAAGDAYALPFAADSLDAVVCHFLLLWLKEPVRALQDMFRVVRPGGWLMAFAEPDYGGRVDYPQELAEPGSLQAHALHLQGADPESGRRLPDWFESIGLEDISCGVIGAEWQIGQAVPPQETETPTLAHDLEKYVSPDTLDRWGKISSAAQARGTRVLFVPTFWAIGRKDS